MISIERYSSALAAQWDSFVASSRNGTFLHFRGYMDYHADRFEDFSLLAFDGKRRLVAVLPAHRQGTVLASHRGLTYGGWIMSDKADMEAMMEIWTALFEMAKAEGFTEILYRPVPYIFHRYPSDEDIYALWRYGGMLDAVQISSAIDLTHPIGFDMAARQAVRKAEVSGITISVSDDFDGFWALLTENLKTTHNASPVHSLDEIKLLHSRFPDNISLYTACDAHQMLAGVVIYHSPMVAHSQYASASPAGKAMRAMPPLYRAIIDEARARGQRYFDFGTSCEEGGRTLNLGLIRQKCGFGGRGVAFCSYRIPVV